MKIIDYKRFFRSFAEMLDRKSECYAGMVPLELSEVLPFMIAWHGTNKQFDKFTLDHFGTGAGGIGMGYGINFAKNRPGGEYFARYCESRAEEGYLYKVELMLDTKDIATLGSIHKPADGLWSWAEYGDLREKLGDKLASSKLVLQGIHALVGYEETKPGHGDTVLCLSPERVRVLETYKYSKNLEAWLLLGSRT